MMTNALDNQITPRPEKSKGCCISASPIRQNRIYNRSSAANVEQTEKLLENQEKKEWHKEERVIGGRRSTRAEKDPQNQTRERS